jgi:hypothetical protein
MHSMNDYAIEIMVRGRLADLRAEAERRNRVELARRAPASLRAVIGLALIRVGARLLGRWNGGATRPRMRQTARGA